MIRAIVYTSNTCNTEWYAKSLGHETEIIYLGWGMALLHPEVSGYSKALSNSRGLFGAAGE